jgi:hypothetical protein
VRDADHGQLLADINAKILSLSARLDAVEREVRNADQVQLLTDINASLQATAKNASKNAQDVQALRNATQGALNAIGPELAKLNAEITKIKEGR